MKTTHELQSELRAAGNVEAAERLELLQDAVDLAYLHIVSPTDFKSSAVGRWLGRALADLQTGTGNPFQDLHHTVLRHCKNPSHPGNCLLCKEPFKCPKT